MRMLTKSKLLLLLSLSCSGIIHTPAFSQVSPGEYAPCQEMPDLITKYNADYRAIVRFYTLPANGGFGFGYGGRGGGGDQEGGASPEKRVRLETLYHDYLKKLEQLDFKSLPQECKVDYILFKRNLDDKLGSSAREASQYTKVKNWFPFSDSVYALEMLRRRGWMRKPLPNTGRTMRRI
jgi:hypothetical protein